VVYIYSDVGCLLSIGGNLRALGAFGGLQMDDQRQDKGGNPSAVADYASDRDGVSKSRRRLLQGAASTVPMILTLQSGAALARSSNIISETTEAGALTEDGQYYRCLLLSSVDRVDKGADLGEPPSGEYVEIKNMTYYTDDNASSPTVSGATVCKNDVTYFYKDQGFKQIRIEGGGLAFSAASHTSLAGALTLRGKLPTGL
jgi:hypothetical protein